MVCPVLSIEALPSAQQWCRMICLVRVSVRSHSSLLSSPLLRSVRSEYLHPGLGSHQHPPPPQTTGIFNYSRLTVTVYILTAIFLLQMSSFAKQININCFCGVLSYMTFRYEWSYQLWLAISLNPTTMIQRYKHKDYHIILSIAWLARCQS